MWQHWSIFLLIMALHTKITLRPPCPSQMTVINTESKCYQECKQGCVLLYCWWKFKLIWLLGRIVCRFLKIFFKKELLCNPKVSATSGYLKNSKSGNITINILDLDKDFLSFIRWRNDVLCWTVGGTGMDGRLSKISQTQKGKDHFSFTCEIYI